MAQINESELSEAENDALHRDGHLSRRIFLKMVGATVVGTVAGTLPVPPVLANAMALPVSTAPYATNAMPAQSAQAITPASRDEAWAIAVASPLFQQVIAELNASHFVFDTTSAGFQHASDHGTLVGLKLEQIRSANRRMGASVVLTVNVQAEVLTGLQYLVSWCLNTSLEVRSIMFDARGPVYNSPEERGPSQSKVSRELRRPRRAENWSFDRDDPLPSRPEELVIEGWPPDSPEACHWFYLGCGSTEWAVDRGLVIHRCMQVVEERSCQTGQQRVLDLTYQNINWR